MTVHQASPAATRTYRIDYEDPAGAFGGWFLFVVQDDQGLDDFGPPYALTTHGKTVFKAAVEPRLAEMFGPNRATYEVTLVESVTPAVVDTDF